MDITNLEIYAYVWTLLVLQGMYISIYVYYMPKMDGMHTLYTLVLPKSVRFTKMEYNEIVLFNKITLYVIIYELDDLVGTCSTFFFFFYKKRKTGSKS